MKKKLLFVIPTLSCGGAERALVALLNKINYKDYEVDLILFRRDDMYYGDQVPEQVNILENDVTTKLCFEHVKHVIKSPIRFKRLNVVILRFFQTAHRKINEKFKVKKYYYEWVKLKKHVPTLAKEYDTAIGFLEGTSVYYIVDKVKAKKRIGWLRTDYEQGGFDKKHDLPYFQKLDTIFAVSEPNAARLRSLYPKFSHKIKAFYNILDVDEIYYKADLETDWDNDYNGTRIVSVGNLRHVKGYDLAVEACSILIKQGYKFKWYVCGEGIERNNLEKQIEECGLQDIFVLLGQCENPYYYIKNADIYVQTSRHEGFSTTIRETKVLKKALVITDCPGMREQIVDGKNGSISGNDAKSIALKIKELLDSEDKLKSYERELCIAQTSLDNNAEQMDLFYRNL